MRRIETTLDLVPQLTIWTLYELISRPGIYLHSGNQIAHVPEDLH